MNVSIVGSGAAATAAAANLADLGHDVTAVDDDETWVATLNDGEAPVDTPGLQPLLDAHVGRGLRATTDHGAVRGTDLTVLAAETPTDAAGHVDLALLEAATRRLGEALADAAGYHLVVVQSAVVPGTTGDRLVPLLEETSGRTVGTDLGVAVVPPFRDRGGTVADLVEVDRLVVGTDGDDRALDRLAELYEPLVADWDTPVVETGRREAEMVTYAESAVLAARHSLANELGNICREHGVDADEVADALGRDERVGAPPLRADVGWGGPRLPRDLEVLVRAARERGYDPDLLEAVVGVNERQPRRMVDLLAAHVDPTGERVAVLGLAFEAGTDDVRGSPAEPVIEALQDRGATVVAYDPVANEPMRERFPDVEYADSAGAALEGAVGALVVTGWEEFATLDDAFDRMAEPVVVDGQRVVTRRAGLTYDGLAW